MGKKIAVRRRCQVKIGILMLVLMSLLCGCGNGGVSATEPVAGKTYVYTGEPFSKMDDDRFVITFNEDGTFSYYESLLSSYLGFGTWEIKDGIVTMTDDAQMGFPIQNSFRIDGEELVFVEEGSSNFIYVKVQNGERFTVLSDMDR